MKKYIFAFLLFPAILAGQSIMFKERTDLDFKPVQTVAKQRTRINFKALILPAVAGFGGGAALGGREKTLHHWGEFHERFPNANPQFWNPALSWKNKYVDGNPDLGRTKFIGLTIPAQFTDGYHMMTSANQGFVLLAGGSIFIGRKVSWKEYALRFVASSIGYWAGNELTFRWAY